MYVAFCDWKIILTIFFPQVNQRNTFLQKFTNGNVEIMREKLFCTCISFDTYQFPIQLLLLIIRIYFSRHVQ